MDDHIKQGEKLFDEGEIEKSEKLFLSLLEKNPEDVESMNNLGAIHYAKGNLQKAVSLFESALGIDSNYDDALGNLAICLEKKGDYAEAAQLFENKMQSSDNSPETLISIINCRIKSGDFSKAKAFIKKLALLHNDPEYIKNTAKQLARDLNKALNSGEYPAEKIIKYYLETGNLNAARDILIPALNHDRNLQDLKNTLIGKEKIKRLPVAIISAADLLEKDPARKLRWGDYWFARELAAALFEEGAVINAKGPKVLIHLHGIPIEKIDGPSYNMIWIHSHPDLITPDFLSFYDHIFCLSPGFLDKIREMGREGQLLVGGTSKEPPPGICELSHDIVFVGNGRRDKGRKIIHDLMSAGNGLLDHLEVWGEGWDGILPEKCIRGLYFNNEKLSDLYASSKVVLNDHHEGMLREGFINPRILDVMASGGVVISDSLAGAQELFGDALLTYTTPADLMLLIDRIFRDDGYREKIRRAGLEAVKSYSFRSAARQIISHMTSIDENRLEIRAKNLYMKKVWAPVKGKIDTDRIRRLKKVTAEQCEGSTLDVGCANGDSTAIMKKHNPSLDLTGLELTDWGYREAINNHSDIKFVQGDAKELPFADRSFDTVTLDHVIEHFSDPVPLILEARRVARKRVVIGIPIMHLNDPDHKISWRVDDFKNLLCGFFPEFSIRGMREPDGIEINDALKWNFVVGTGFLKDNIRKEIPPANPLKLHLGCGGRHLAGFLNIDIMPSSAVDLLCDSRRLPFAAGTVSRIETYHMIEHLPRHDFLEALFEWNRILEEGGALIIECPDFDATVKEYVEGKRFRINNIFGLQRHPGDYHLFGYTFNDLEEILQGVGFREIRQEAPTDYHAQDEPSLRITAIKVRHILHPADLRSLSIRDTQHNYAKALESEKNTICKIHA
jgi:predicted SAM-dependent methyltransferase/tetratricopeptide (TPR) repeat protein